MSEILLKADDARSAAGDMKKAAEAAESQFTATRGRLTELAGSFKGQTATNFDAKFEEWRTSATQLIQALQDLATFLDSAATTIEQTDADIASKLG
jgi:WXG100 family type VII secretion target